MTYGPIIIHNPSSPCSCALDVRGASVSIVYCKLHKAATDLLFACNEMVKEFGTWSETQIADYDSVALAKAALTKAGV